MLDFSLCIMVYNGTGITALSPREDHADIARFETVYAQKSCGR